MRDWEDCRPGLSAGPESRGTRVSADRDYPLVPKVEVQGFQKGTAKNIKYYIVFQNIILYFKIFFCFSIQIIIFALTDKADMRII